ncbi:hypothetical protein CWATWH8502_187 [Crocosphaera watsonii WH 8502]|uniref:Uncharacterized protein n=5 Tax=Crocosphaera watsonii TaxID=263511 RepID=T2JS10_CROWT|nr:hypothetical protein CWATWH0003_0069 [Crocosphaera watsonii WH 0003]CCQ52549.1 hypothetical protein CWATWH8502_187 [Crocosphaera watsonii WH 8502]CCQ57943.1 hypothetical protein CWATWH0005_747 [Crocosphaera watsonii WH 0005]CCQ62543.1 hypothetical protein CWATWH0401_1020 [Crocosphaera watsonii WH 0401]CCQ67347.1 hypothetical protein CWATWH0402_5119 [Crocosphaera watsonii WH 0402]
MLPKQRFTKVPPERAKIYKMGIFICLFNDFVLSLSPSR